MKIIKERMWKEEGKKGRIKRTELEEVKNGEEKRWTEYKIKEK